MKHFSTIICSMLVVLMSSFAYGATLTVDVDGLDSLLPDAIWSYQLNFDVIGGTDWFITDSSVSFNETTQHQLETAPGIFLTNWNLNSNAFGNQLVILADDKDCGTDPTKSPLVNGTLFTVQYPDEIKLSLSLDSFILASDLTTAVNMSLNPDPAVFGEGDNTLILNADSNAVPIPSAILLLSGGLLGMLGIRRKIKQ